MAVTKQLTTGPIAPVPPIASDAVHVDTLHDYDLCVLLDVHLFGQSAWCNGVREWRQVSSGVYVHQCRTCGATEAEESAGSHVRQAPWYSIDQIVSAMALRGDQYFLRFALLFYQRGCGKSSVSRALVPEVMRLVASLRSPRLAALVALEALGMIDEQGYIKGGR